MVKAKKSQWFKKGAGNESQPLFALLTDFGTLGGAGIFTNVFQAHSRFFRIYLIAGPIDACYNKKD